MRACCLGLVFSIGISLASSSWPCQLLGWYLATLAIFHWSEYFTTAITNPRHLALDSYILDHSSAYHVAVVSSFVEFFVEYYFFPGSIFHSRLQNFKSSCIAFEVEYLYICHIICFWWFQWLPSVSKGMRVQQVKSRNSTRLKLAIDDQHWNITIHNIITHARQIKTDYRLWTAYHKPIIDYVKNSIFTSLIRCPSFQATWGLNIFILHIRKPYIKARM